MPQGRAFNTRSFRQATWKIKRSHQANYGKLCHPTLCILCTEPAPSRARTQTIQSPQPNPSSSLATTTSALPSLPLSSAGRCSRPGQLACFSLQLNSAGNGFVVLAFDFAHRRALPPSFLLNDSACHASCRQARSDAGAWAQPPTFGPQVRPRHESDLFEALAVRREPARAGSRQRGLLMY